MDAATAITADAAADLFSVLPDVRAEKAPGADQPPRGFFSPEFSFSETVSVSVLLFPAFPSLLFFLFFFFLRSSLIMTNLLDRIQTDALRHAQRKPHLCHKEYKRGTSVTDKRQNDTGIRNRIGNNRNI